MFNDSAGCELVGYDYTDKHDHRLALHLLHAHGPPPFRVAFTNIAAYRINRNHLGKVIASVRSVPPAELIKQDWERVHLAEIAGMWPQPRLTDPDSASAFVSSAGLRGYRIAFDSGTDAWAISRDFILLGQRSNYPFMAQQ